MRILLTGGSGQVGSALKARLSAHQVVAPSRSEFDLERLADIKAFVQNVKPNLLINCAAFTAVDGAERESGRASIVNGAASGLLAVAARNSEAAIVHLSTDYVFDGHSTRPYREIDECAPVNIYGKTKMDGERLVESAGVPHLIVRTSWVYAASGRNFLRTMLHLGMERPEIDVVDDQIGAPTPAAVVAEIIAALVEQMNSDPNEYLTRRGGKLNVTCTGQTSWHGFATAIFEEARCRGLPLVLKDVRPVKTAEYPAAARRPLYSVLDLSRLERNFGIVPRSWRDALPDVMNEIAPVETVHGPLGDERRSHA